MRCNAEFYYVGKIPRRGIGCPSLERGVVLKWFYSPRAVGAPLSEVKCALSALLVIITIFLLAILAMSEKVAFVCSCVCDTRIDGQTDRQTQNRYHWSSVVRNVRLKTNFI